MINNVQVFVVSHANSEHRDEFLGRGSYVSVTTGVFGCQGQLGVVATVRGCGWGWEGWGRGREAKVSR